MSRKGCGMIHLQVQVNRDSRFVCRLTNRVACLRQKVLFGGLVIGHVGLALRFRKLMSYELMLSAVADRYQSARETHENKSPPTPKTRMPLTTSTVLDLPVSFPPDSRIPDGEEDTKSIKFIFARLYDFCIAFSSSWHACNRLRPPPPSMLVRSNFHAPHSKS